MVKLAVELRFALREWAEIFAIGFAEEFDESARYLIEYFDGVWYVLKE